MIPVRVSTVMLLLLVPAASVPQGLGDAAQRERDRRARQERERGGPAVVLTNEDLKKEGENQPKPGGEAQGQPGAAARKPQSPPQPAAQPAVVAEGPTPLELRRQREREFEQAIADARARVQAVQERLERLQAQLNPMSTTFIYGPTGSNNASDEMRARQELQQGQAALAEATEGVARAEEALDLFRRGSTDVQPGGAAPPR